MEQSYCAYLGRQLFVDHISMWLSDLYGVWTFFMFRFVNPIWRLSSQNLFEFRLNLTIQNMYSQHIVHTLLHRDYRECPGIMEQHFSMITILDKRLNLGDVQFKF